MKDIDNLPLSAFMPHHPSDDPHAPFTAKAGKKNNNCNKKIQFVANVFINKVDMN